MEAIEINKKALNMLSLQKHKDAQKLFIYNALKHPSHQTYNNLGVFLITEGLSCTGRTGFFSHELGLICLKLAKLFSCSQINLCSLAKAYDNIAAIASPKRKRRLYSRACLYLKQALGIKYSDTIMYNVLRLCCLIDPKSMTLLHDIQKLMDHFICDESVSLYLKILQENSSQERVLDCISRYSEYLDDTELLMFYAKSKLYEKGFQLSKTVLDNYFPDGFISAAIIECCINTLNTDRIPLFLQQISDTIDNIQPVSYRRKLAALLDELSLSADNRQKLIASYSSLQPFLDSCYYFGCDSHNTTWQIVS